MRLAVVVVVAAACGDNLPDPTAARSGSRLKLAWYEYEGGARELETSWYHDSVLGQRCTPALWSDGKHYCTPATDEAVYITDTCTRSLGRTLKRLEPAPFFASTFKLAGESLPLRSRMFTRGAPTLPPVSVWQKGTDGCLLIEVGDNFDYFELGAELVVDDLVQLVRSEPHGNGSLAVITQTSDDGFSVPIALFDRDSASECAPIVRPNSDELWCVPAAAGTISYFHDAECTQPELASPAGSTPELAVQFDVPTSCWTGYAVGTEVSGTPIYESSGPLCVETAPPAGRRFFTMAAMQPLPALARVRDATTSRIRAISGTDGELRIADPLMYDAELDTECQHDSKLACAPRTAATLTRASAHTFYADAQCLTAIDLAQVPMGACDPPVRFATDGDNYYPLGQPYLDTIYVPSTGDTCSQYAPAAPFLGYTVGPPIDASTFAHAKLTIDR
jgi:hypothetical protein